MIFLLYGPDTYRSRVKLRELVSAFAKKHGEALAVTRLDLEDQPDGLESLYSGATLFSEARLVIIENASAAPAKVRDGVLERLKFWAKDGRTVVVFREGVVGEKNEEFVSGLRSLATKSQQFGLLTPAKVLAWFGSEAKKMGIKISPSAGRAMIQESGPDLWRLSNELDKIRSGAGLETKARQQEKIWNFTDKFLSDSLSGLPALVRLVEDGFEQIYIIGALAGALRNLAAVWHGRSSGHPVQPIKNLHPFVAKKYALLARSMTSKKLGDYYSWVLDADIAVKTGKLPGWIPVLKLTLRRPRPF